MATSPTREEIAARIEAAEARTDTKIAHIDGKLDVVISKIDSLQIQLTEVRNDYRGIRANIWLVGLGLAALIVAIAFGIPSIYDFGMKLRDAVHTEVQSEIGKLPQQPAR